MEADLMNKWEYRIESGISGSKEREYASLLTNEWLNRLGEDGCEVITIEFVDPASALTRTSRLIFKRPIS